MLRFARSHEALQARLPQHRLRLCDQNLEHAFAGLGFLSFKVLLATLLSACCHRRGLISTGRNGFQVRARQSDFQLQASKVLARAVPGLDKGPACPQQDQTDLTKLARGPVMQPFVWQLDPNNSKSKSGCDCALYVEEPVCLYQVAMTIHPHTLEPRTRKCLCDDLSPCLPDGMKRRDQCGAAEGSLCDWLPFSS